MLFRLPAEPWLFPDPRLAEPDGLLAVGGDLSPERLIAAYRAGIYPWFNERPYLWWSPDPRGVILPETLHIPRRLHRAGRQAGFTLTTDTAFDAVCAACATTVRPGGQKGTAQTAQTAQTGREEHEAREEQASTWITPEMQTAYARLHARNVAHSVEVWQAGKLVGGLYGVLLGGVFCGESMYYRVPDASKVGFAWFAQQFFAAGGTLIDCQQMTAHMIRFGAIAMPRATFLEHLAEAEKSSVAIFAPHP